MRRISIGDIVQLRSGGPAMTVVVPEFQQTEESEEILVKVAWFSQNENVMFALFDDRALRVIEYSPFESEEEDKTEIGFK